MNYYKNIVSQILKMTSDGFIITDTEGNVREINKQYADFFGKSRSEIRKIHFEYYSQFQDD